MAVFHHPDSVEPDVDPRDFPLPSSGQQLALPDFDSSSFFMRADSPADQDEVVFSSPPSAGAGLGYSSDLFAASTSSRGLFMPTASQPTSHSAPQLLPQPSYRPSDDSRLQSLLSPEPTPTYGSFGLSSPVAAASNLSMYPSPSAYEYTTPHSHPPTNAAVSGLTGYYHDHDHGHNHNHSQDHDYDHDHDHGHGHGHDHDHNHNHNHNHDHGHDQNHHSDDTQPLGRTPLPSIEVAEPGADADADADEDDDDERATEAEAEEDAGENGRRPVDPADWRARLRYCERARNKAALEASLVRLLEFPEGISDKELAARRAANLRFDRVREQRLKDRNNEAAKRSRQRKIQRIEAAERRIAALAVEREDLREQVSVLQQEVTVLRERLRRRQRQRQLRVLRERPGGGTTRAGRAGAAAEEEGEDGDGDGDGDGDVDEAGQTFKKEEEAAFGELHHEDVFMDDDEQSSLWG